MVLIGQSRTLLLVFKQTLCEISTTFHIVTVAHQPVHYTC